jgi:hypothetical protein
MPYLTELINNGTGILHVGSGVLLGQEVIDVVTNLSGKIPQPERITHGLVDLTEVTDFRVSTNELRVITQIDRQHAENMKEIFVAIAAPEDIEYGVSRMYASILSNPGWTIQIFRTKHQALAWLDLQLQQKV